jgi:hypothetical protein
MPKLLRPCSFIHVVLHSLRIGKGSSNVARRFALPLSRTATSPKHGPEEESHEIALDCADSSTEKQKNGSALWYYFPSPVCDSHSTAARSEASKAHSAYPSSKKQFEQARTQELAALIVQLLPASPELSVRIPFYGEIIRIGLFYRLFHA